MCSAERTKLKKTLPERTRISRVKSSGKRNRFFIVAVNVMAFLVLSMVLAVIGSSVLSINPSALLKVFSSPVFRSTMSVTLLTSSIVVLLSIFLGTPVAYVLAMRKFFFSRLADTVISIPMVLPPLVSGYAILILFSEKGLLGVFSSSVIFSRAGIIIAQFFVASPFYINSARESFASVPRNLLDACYTLRASEWYIFSRIMIPMSKKGLAAGVVMTWARAVGEFGATAMVAGSVPGKTETVTVAIYISATGGDNDMASALSLLLIVFSFTCITFIMFRSGANHEG